jgi:hypothetical protein
LRAPIKVFIFFIIFLTTTPLFAADKSVLIPNGFGTGQSYIDMSEYEKRCYAMGAINGMLIAPFFGASANEMEWFVSYLANMTDKQVAAILSKYLQDNPGRWHNGLNVLMYSAIREAYDKSRSGGKK